ncbi:unnamed protein product, partial [Discosporangium mesarthrocarpum]
HPADPLSALVHKRVAMALFNLMRNSDSERYATSRGATATLTDILNCTADEDTAHFCSLALTFRSSDEISAEPSSPTKPGVGGASGWGSEGGGGESQEE